MNPLPSDRTSFRPLYDLLTGAIGSRLITAALELQVFDSLEHYRSCAEISERLGTQSARTGFFLDALVTLGLLQKRRSEYINTADANRFLRSDSPLYLGPLFKMVRQMSIDPLDQLPESLLKPPDTSTSPEQSASSALWAEGARSAAPWALGNMGIRLAELVSELDGFAGFRRMLDLGGGHGIFTLYIVQTHDSLRGVVFDQAPVVAVAREFIEAYGMNQRVDVLPGDYHQDPLGDDYDLILASSTLSLAKDKLDALVHKVQAALNPRGFFVSLHDGLTNEKTQPATALGSLGWLLKNGEDTRCESGEIAASMKRCGFDDIVSHPMETPMGQLELVMGRKP